MNLRGAIIVITGARRGIGQALLEELSAQGATVIGCSLQGDPARGIQAVDVRNPAAVGSFLADCVRAHGRIDVVIANAGWGGGSMHPLEKTTLEDYERMMRTNIDGTFFFLREAVPILRRQNSGAIVTIGSRAGRRGHPGLSLYCTSKFAVKGMMESLARELLEEKSAVRSYLISPGGVDTDMRTELFGEEDSHRQQSPKIIAQIVSQILSGKLEVPHGADVGIVDGKVKDILTLS